LHIVTQNRKNVIVEMFGHNTLVIARLPTIHTTHLEFQITEKIVVAVRLA